MQAPRADTTRGLQTEVEFPSDLCWTLEGGLKRDVFFYPFPNRTDGEQEFPQIGVLWPQLWGYWSVLGQRELWEDSVSFPEEFKGYEILFFAKTRSHWSGLILTFKHGLRNVRNLISPNLKGLHILTTTQYLLSFVSSSNKDEKRWFVMYTLCWILIEFIQSNLWK